MKVGSRYRYYRGGDYVVVASYADTETGERVVSYRRLDGTGEIVTCSLASFLKPVPFDGRTITRFRRI